MKRSALKTKEPRSKKSKSSGFKLVDEPESEPVTQSTPTPNIFESGASGLEGIDIDVDDLINTPPSQHRHKSTPEASSQRTPQPDLNEVVLKVSELYAVVTHLQKQKQSDKKKIDNLEADNERLNQLVSSQAN